MVIDHTASQSPDNYYFKIYNLGNISSFTAFAGRFYVCFSVIPNFGKIISSQNKKCTFPLNIFCKKYTDPFMDETRIEEKVEIYFENFRIFRHIRLSNLLKKYGFSTNEINLLFEELNLDDKIYADNIIHIRIKAAILIDILFKKNDLILFHTAGLSYPSSKVIYQRIYKRLQEHPEKSAIVFEYGEKIKQIVFKEVSVDNISNYEGWMADVVKKLLD